MKRLLLSLSFIFLNLVSWPSLFAQENAWPRTVPLDQGMVTIYSPQIDSKTGEAIQFRAALAFRKTPGAEPVFGAGWFESAVVIDTANRIVHPTDFVVTETRFPEGTDDIKQKLSTVLAQQSPGWNMDFSLDELDAALKTAELETSAVNTAPPTIIYRDHPALLISIDGEPVLREIENSPLKAVINTPYPLIFDGKYYYLNAATDVWYRSRKATGPYQFETTPPTEIAAMVNTDEAATEQQQPSEPITAANAPEIVVSTEPAELIVTEGPAAFVPLVDDLLVLQNSENDVFMHVSTQEFYIVLAGRWYRSNSLTGPWAYQPANELPQVFADIPRDSNQADSRVYVAGTPEARDAVLDAQVPQTAAVKRGEVDIEVRYDGEPVYQPVDGTDLVYINNTGSTVLVSGGLYYLVEEGVWYVSASPNGPWQVSDHRPAQVDTILPTSPVYNTKYVYVYDSTPSVVYVGYTPGYIGSYVYRNTLFYGTGWYYQPWVSPYYYYPRFSTWGFNVGYNPWSGWNFGLSWGWGPFSVGYYTGGYWHRNHYWYHPHHGRWGPGRYRARPVHHHRGHDRYAYSGNRRSGHDRYDGRYDDDRYDNSRDRNGNGRPRDNGGSRNLYSDDSQRARIASTRDKRMRSSDKTAAYNRQVVNTRNDGRRVQNYAGKTKPERNRTGPVSSAELRTKAKVRDVNLEASRSTLVADNNGRVYSKAGRNPDRYTQFSKDGKSRRSTASAASRPVQKPSAVNRGTRQALKANVASNRQVKQKTLRAGQRERATTRSPGRQSQSSTPAKTTRQKPVSQSRTAVQQPRSRAPQKSVSQRPSSTPRATAQKSRQVTTRSNNRQRTASRASVQTQRQKQHVQRPQAGRSKVSSPKTTARAPKALQKSSQKASRKSNVGKSGSTGAKGSGKNRSGKQ
jgi:hypothetical protein